MPAASMLARYDLQQRIHIQERGFRREAAPGVVRLVNEGDGEGMVIHSRLAPDCADAVIAREIGYFSALGQDFEWKVYGHDGPADLKDRLLAQGFVPEDPEAFLVLDLDAPPAGLLAPVALDIRRISDPSLLDGMAGIDREVWGRSDPAFLAARKRDLQEDPGHVSFYMAYADGEAVAHARITFQDGSDFAGLWGGSTRPGFRGRGFYTALLAARLQEARGRGIRYLTIDASPMSRPIVERHGFRLLTLTQPFKFQVAGG